MCTFSSDLCLKWRSADLSKHSLFQCVKIWRRTVSRFQHQDQLSCHHGAKTALASDSHEISFHSVSCKTVIFLVKIGGKRANWQLSALVNWISIRDKQAGDLARGCREQQVALARGKGSYSCPLTTTLSPLSQPPRRPCVLATVPLLCPAVYQN